MKNSAFLFLEVIFVFLIMSARIGHNVPWSDNFSPPSDGHEYPFLRISAVRIKHPRCLSLCAQYSKLSLEAIHSPEHSIPSPVPESVHSQLHPPLPRGGRARLRGGGGGGGGGVKRHPAKKPRAPVPGEDDEPPAQQREIGPGVDFSSDNAGVGQPFGFCGVEESGGYPAYHSSDSSGGAGGGRVDSADAVADDLARTGLGDGDSGSGGWDVGGGASNARGTATEEVDLGGGSEPRLMEPEFEGAVPPVMAPCAPRRRKRTPAAGRCGPGREHATVTETAV